MPEGEVMIADMGLVLGAARPGEGEGDCLSKGVLRQRALPGPVVDMLPITLFAKVLEENYIILKGMMISRIEKESLQRPYLSN